MLSKKEIKDIQSLSQKKFRRELKLFVAEGPKIVEELLQLMPDGVQNIYAVRDWIDQQKHSGFAVTEVTGSELEKISQLKTPNQVLAVLKQIEPREPKGEGFILYLDTIQDPGNFGTIIRTADWFNVGNVVCSEACADLYNSKVVQSTMASIARVNVYYDETGTWLQQQTLPIYAASLNGRPIHDFQGVNAGVLVIGNESKGISKEIEQLATEKITIPRKGGAESLNAAVATGILLAQLKG